MTDKLINMIESVDDSKKILAALKLKGVTYQRIAFELAAINHEEPFSINFTSEIQCFRLKVSVLCKKIDKLKILRKQILESDRF